MHLHVTHVKLNLAELLKYTQNKIDYLYASVYIHGVS